MDNLNNVSSSAFHNYSPITVSIPSSAGTLQPPVFVAFSSGSSVLPENGGVSGSQPSHLLFPGSSSSLQLVDRSSQNKASHKGVIYALSQYSPYISMPPHHSHMGLPLSGAGGENENSNLGPEDVEEVRKMTTAAVNASIHHEQLPQREAGKCQAGGELRLSKLAEKLDSFVVPEGFSLVGAKSPMLQGMVLVVLVDKRFLPGDPNTITMLGFTGSCIGCGTTGFRYFTEFSSHINLKLATQPKKQKHLKYYIHKTADGKWTRGPFIPWKGTETRKRSVTKGCPLFAKSPVVVPRSQETQEDGAQDDKFHYDNSTSVIVTAETGEPLEKKSRQEPNDQPKEEENVQLDPDNSNACDIEGDMTFTIPLSSLCGVRPVLLLCQHNTFKLPNNINDIIISDLLVGCFDFPDTLNQPQTKAIAETSSTFKHSGFPIMSSAVDHSNIEQNAANTLLHMGDTNLTDEEEKLPNFLRAKKSSEPNNLSLPAAIVLLIQYLCSLDDLSVNKEQIELMLNKAKIECSTSNPILSQLHNSSFLTGPQLSLIINLQCMASNNRIKVISSTTSFQNALFKALRWLHDTFYMSSISKKKPVIPSFIITLSVPTTGPLEFGVLVTGITHAKILAECLGVSTIVRTPFPKAYNILSKQFNDATSSLESLLHTFETSRSNLVYIPFNGYAGMRVTQTKAKNCIPEIAPISIQPLHTKGIFSIQVAMAQQLLKQVRNIADNPEILDLAAFMKVHIVIVVPKVITLFNLTVKRLQDSDLLNYLGLETEEACEDFETVAKYVITYSDWPESISKWLSFVHKAETCHDSLFLLVFDQAQKYCLPQGMPDVLPNLKKVFECPNVIPMFVTSVPYLFQSRKSFIDPDNEVYWTDNPISGTSKFSDENCVMVNDRDMVYFGIKEFCDSIRWNQQYPLVRHDETFEVATVKANKVSDINYSTVHGFVLLRLYQSAMMVGGGIKPAEPYTVMSIIRMVNDIIESPLRNADGSGSMMMIRIPNVQMGKYFHSILLKTRNSLGFQYRFDVLLDDSENELRVSQYFLERMRFWRRKRGWEGEKVKSWRPRCLEDLLDLPCFLILSGEKRGGDTLPRSLKYVDFNILNHSCFHRSTIEAEIGAVSCYLSNAAVTHSEISAKPVVMNNMRSSTSVLPRQHDDDSTDKPTCHSDKCLGCLGKDLNEPHTDTSTHFSSKYPLPILLVSKPLWILLESTSGLANLNSDPNTRWVHSDRPLLTALNHPDRMSRHYRRWTDARPARKILTTPCNSSQPSPNPDHQPTEKRDHRRMFTISKGDQNVNAVPEEGNVYLSEYVDEDDKDNEDCDKAQYHPRCLLLSGPPQAGKTGAYLHFAQILHRMLLRLKRVDVLDNPLTYHTAENAVLTEHPCKNNVTSIRFVSQYLDASMSQLSRVHVATEATQVEQVKIDTVDSPGVKTSPVILAKTSAFDMYHHCDMCRFYREGIGETSAQVYNYTVQEVEMKVHIPLMHTKHFDVEEDTYLGWNTSGSKIKTPVLMFSICGDEEGLLNLFHAMEECDYVHITFVKHDELEKYKQRWLNHVFVSLPQQYNNVTRGVLKNIIKEFAAQNHSYEKSLGRGTMWPFVLIIPDNIVMWQKYGIEQQESDSEDDDENDVIDKPRGPDAIMSSLRSTSSLLSVMRGMESQPHLREFAVVSIRPWSSAQDESLLPQYLSTFLHTMIFLNIDRCQSVGFNAQMFSGEDVDFQLKLLDREEVCIRFEQFSFMAKSRANWPPSFQLDQELVVAPDIENIAVCHSDASLVLETHLARCGGELFPLAIDNPSHPVLIIGRYVNLEPRIKVHVAHTLTDDHFSDTEFSGLVIFAHTTLTKDSLLRLKFVKNAQLLFACEERYRLRSEATRLDLEDSWRIRLRDEYQTATDATKIFFLTGTYLR